MLGYHLGGFHQQGYHLGLPSPLGKIPWLSLAVCWVSLAWEDSISRGISLGNSRQVPSLGRIPSAGVSLGNSRQCVRKDSNSRQCVGGSKAGKIPVFWGFQGWEDSNSRQCVLGITWEDSNSSLS